VVDSRGRRIVLDPQNGFALIVQNPDGSYWNNTGSEHIHLEYSYDMAIDSRDNLVISHAGDYYGGPQSLRYGPVDRIQPGVVVDIGSAGSGDGQFLQIYGVAVDHADRIFATDRNLNRVQVFQPGYTGAAFIAKFGSTGIGNGQFRGISGLAVSSAGEVLVADRDNARVQVLYFDGSKLSFSRMLSYTFSKPTDVAIDSGDNVYVTDNGLKRVLMFDRSGSFITSFDGPTDGYPGKWNNPMSCTIDRTGLIIVCDTGYGSNDDHSQRIATARPSVSIGSVKKLADGSMVTLASGVVTVVVPSPMQLQTFYVEDIDRTAGVRVNAWTAPQAGDVVDVSGTITTTPDGERQINNASVLKVGSERSVKPYFAIHHGSGSDETVLMDGTASYTFEQLKTAIDTALMGRLLNPADSIQTISDELESGIDGNAPVFTFILPSDKLGNGGEGQSNIGMNEAFKVEVNFHFVQYNDVTR
jgi:hypothetical protein